MTHSNSVSAALIGISGYGRIHYALAMQAVRAGRMRLEAATVINPLNEPDKCRELLDLGCTIYADYREMLSEHRNRLDLCLIPTGIGWHTPMTVAALEAGANVLVEKPLAGDLAGVDAIRMAQKRADRFVAVGFQDIYAANVWELKERLIAGKIGKLRRLKFTANWPRMHGYYRRTSWAGRLWEGGTVINDSPLNNAFAHILNLALFLAGPTLKESAQASVLAADLLRANDIESFDTACFLARLSTGPELWCSVSHSYEREHGPVLTLEGDAGQACWHVTDGITMTPSHGETEKFPCCSAEAARDRMFAQVVRRVWDPDTFICTTAIARSHAEVIDTLHRQFHIRDIPASRRRDIFCEDDVLRVVDGLDEAVDEAARNNLLLRDTDWFNEM